MQTTSTNAGRDSAKRVYYRQRAEYLRTALADAELKLNAKRQDVAGFTKAGKPLPFSLQQSLEYHEYKVRDYSKELSRALFNLGRL